MVDPNAAKEATVDRERRSKMLLILDNLEHLLTAERRILAFLLELLESSRELKVLVTSRQILELPDIEHAMRVEPLPFPAIGQDHLVTAETLDQYPAIALFVDRARDATETATYDVGPENLANVAKICRLLEGVPLAIKLAAAQAGKWSASALVERLQKTSLLDALVSKDVGHPNGYRVAGERDEHRSVRLAIKVSYDLLTEAERTLFRRLSVFVDGWSDEAAEAVTADPLLPRDSVPDLLDSLCAKSLISMVPLVHGRSRYRMLGLIRAFANERAEAEEVKNAAERHAFHYQMVAARVRANVRGADERRWLDEQQVDLANTRVALERFHDQHRRDLCCRMASDLTWYWNTRGYLAEGVQWLTEALTMNGEIEPELLAEVTRRAGKLKYYQHEYDDAQELLDEAMRLGEALPESTARTFHLGQTSSHLGTLARALAAERPAEREMLLERAEQDLTIAVEHYRKFVDGSSNDEERDRRRIDLACGQMHLAIVMHLQRKSDQAHQLLNKSIEVMRSGGHRAELADALMYRARIRIDFGGPDGLNAAVSDLRECLDCQIQLDDRPGLAECMEAMVVLAVARAPYRKDLGELVTAECLVVIAATLRERIQLQPPGDEEVRYENAERALKQLLGDENRRHARRGDDASNAIIQSSTREMMARFQDFPVVPRPRSRKRASSIDLDDAELAILNLVCKGTTNRVIAESLGYRDDRLVERMLKRIYDVLGAKDRANAAYIAADKKLCTG